VKAEHHTQLPLTQITYFGGGIGGGSWGVSTPRTTPAQLKQVPPLSKAEVRTKCIVLVCGTSYEVPHTITFDHRRDYA